MGIVDNYIGDGNGLGRIFNSRNSSFLPEIMREANGYGLDVVLNSLSGDLLHASWKCLAEFGKMLENGKRDFIGQGQLPMDPFEANRTFYGVDLTLYVDRRPLVINSLLERAMEWCSQGAIQPIKPVKYFEAHQAEDVLRGMQSGQHIGKLVMVDHGARKFIYLSRSGGKGKDDAALVDELREARCTAQIIAGSVVNKADVQKAIAQAKYPIAGILQMSMVLKDASFPNMTYEEWQDAILPKIQGTWSLHEAFASQSLDFFVLFSSFAGLIGHWGQATYASANTFLDAFAQFRHSKGLLASVLDISIIGDVGWVS
ncbi:hypothetical protein EYC80_003356 [Monilinia laxa]|nr:hypothetical protein EYC80_003356 [Monilinia laxa]